MNYYTEGDTTLNTLYVTCNIVCADDATTTTPGNVQHYVARENWYQYNFGLVYDV